MTPRDVLYLLIRKRKVQCQLDERASVPAKEERIKLSIEERLVRRTDTQKT